jgi:hypothetical protein
MSVVIVEQEFTVPQTVADILGPAETGRSCLELYRVQPRRHYRASDGMRCTCVFEAPDAEAMRNVMRTFGAPPPKGLWAATVHPGPGENASRPPVLGERSALALVERTFQQPVVFADIQALEDAGAECLTLHRVRFLRSYFSTDRRRMVCLYEAPDVEAVRTANRQVGLPFDRVWGAEVIAH